jgi:hypothetical protein
MEMGRMNKIDKLIKQAEKRVKLYPKVNYDFSKLTTEELKEIAFSNPIEERLKELVDKMR